MVIIGGQFEKLFFFVGRLYIGFILLCVVPKYYYCCAVIIMHFLKNSFPLGLIIMKNVPNILPNVPLWHYLLGLYRRSKSRSRIVWAVFKLGRNFVI